MKLRQKTLLIIIITLISLIGVLYLATSTILLENIRNAEEREAEQSVNSFLTLFSFTQQNYSEAMADWSAWDLSYTFIKDKNQKFIDENVSLSSLKTLKVDVMLFVKNSGEWVYGLGFGKEQLTEDALPVPLRQLLTSAHQFLQHADPFSIKTGILQLPDNPFWIVSLPIVTNNHEGPILGTLVVGRYLDANYWARLAKITGIPLTVYRLDETQRSAEVLELRSTLVARPGRILVHPVDDYLVHGYSLLNDIHGQSALIFQLDIPRLAYQRGQQNLFYLVISLLISGLVFGVVVLLALEKWVLLRLDSLSTQVKHIDFKDRNFFIMHVRMDGKDEFSLLANAINDMLEALQMAQVEIMALNESLKEENLRMSAELKVTRRLQQMILPKPEELLKIADLDISGFMEPAEEVGGDYYDVLEHNGRVILGIGDVTGHGLESGMLMLMVQMAVRTLLACEVTDLKTFLSILNQVLYANIQRMNTDKNLSLLLLDRQGSVLRVAGQHEEVLVVRRGGLVERIDTFELGFTIGLEEDIANFIEPVNVRLQPGDGVVLYTDGITEAESPNGELYGIERLCKVISNHWSLPASQIQQAVINNILQHIDTQKIFDDITLLVLKKKAILNTTP
jgi:sigma-B regulation protein RsbU (phosphoserine phosphatase)